MNIEQDYEAWKGNMYAQFNSSELRIGLVQSFPKKRDTLHYGLKSFAEIIRRVEHVLGSVPEITVGRTNKSMAEFARKRFGMDVKLVTERDSNGEILIHCMVTGGTKQIMNIAMPLIVDNRSNIKELDRT